MTNATFPVLSNADRVIIRSAILSHPNGRDTLKSMALSLRFASKADLQRICTALGIDPVATLAAHAAATQALMTSTPAAPAAPAASTPAASTPVEDVEASTPVEDVEASDPWEIEAMAKGVLQPFEAILHPAILSDIRARIDGLMSKAADEIEAARASASAPAPVSRELSANRSAPSTLGKVFGLPGRGEWQSIPVSTWSRCVDTPAIDGGYIFDAAKLGLVVSAVERASNAWVHGPKGAGKTELVRQVAARTGRPFVRIGFADDMDKYALVGQRLPDGSGKFSWHDGVLAAAIRKPGCVILLDEPSAAKPGLLFLLQTSLDVRSLTVEETGEVIPFADGVAFVAADNTDGFGDQSGNYAGTGVLNEAFLDRFPRKVAMATPDLNTLGKIITARTGIATAAANDLAGLIKRSEAMAAQGKLSTHLSLRPVLDFAKDVAAKLPLQACLEATILAAMPATEAQAMRQHVIANFDLNGFKANAYGTHEASPQGSDARADFANA